MLLKQNPYIAGNDFEEDLREPVIVDISSEDDTNEEDESDGEANCVYRE